MKKQENITLKADTQCQATTTRKVKRLIVFPQDKIGSQGESHIIEFYRGDTFHNKPTFAPVLWLVSVPNPLTLTLKNNVLMIPASTVLSVLQWFDVGTAR